MIQYHKMLETVLEHGEKRDDRTRVGTRSIFGYQTRFNLFEGFPLVTTKHTNFNAIKAELLWFLRGSTNVNELDSKIWNEWADSDGDLGPVYGEQWRAWSGLTDDGEPVWVDQIERVIHSIRNNPKGRRHIVSAWNVPQIDAMTLPPCHVMFQFYVSNSGRLSCQLHQRSADLFLGVPFNIASYALLTHIIARMCNLSVGTLVHTFGDLHIYENHLEKAEKVLSRRPMPLPQVEFSLRNWERVKPEDIDPNNIWLVGYDPYPAISAKVAV